MAWLLLCTYLRGELRIGTPTTYKNATTPRRVHCYIQVVRGNAIHLAVPSASYIELFQNKVPKLLR